MKEQLLMNVDPQLAECLLREKERQEGNLEMIASESIQSDLTLWLGGSIWNNKTAVGFPGNQRLMGSQYAEELEKMAAERACRVFGADHANMLPYSGSVANYCAYGACLNLNDRVLAMDPASGAHQTHGAVKNMTAKMYEFSYFGLNQDTMLLDYDQAEELTKRIKPKLIVVGSAAYSRSIDYERLAQIAHDNGALLMTDIAHFSGLIAAGVSPNPVPYADIVTASTTKTMCGPHSGFIMCKKELAQAVDASVYPRTISSLHLQTIAAMAYVLERTQTKTYQNLMKQVIQNAKYLCEALKKRGFDIVSGGTDCHMFVADLRPFDADCVEIAKAMQDVGITVNTKGIPHDPSFAPRGLRAGTTVLTQRGMKEEQMEAIADLWLKIVKGYKQESVLAEVKVQIHKLAAQFPVPDEEWQ